MLVLGATATVADWTADDVRASVQQRLSGLLTWHIDSTISAHPVIRDSFRPLALTPGRVQLASDLVLEDIPGGWVRFSDDALRVVEIVELLLDADQWQEADELYRMRTHDGLVFMELPATSLGRRCAYAFVATPARRAACQQRLSTQRLAKYVDAVGVFSLMAGDVSVAQRYLNDAVEYYRTLGENGDLAGASSHWAGCLTWMGQPARGRGVASEALSITRSIKDRARTRNAYAYLGLADHAAGDTVSAERNFVRADRIEYADDPAGEHLYSLRGCWWAELLLRTGRHLVAWRLTQRNRSIGQLHAWNEDVACCERLLGGCELAEGRLGHAGRHFESAVAVFRRGSSLLDLAYALVDLAEQRRRDGRMDSAGTGLP